MIVNTAAAGSRWDPSSRRVIHLRVVLDDAPDEDRRETVERVLLGSAIDGLDFLDLGDHAEVEIVR